MAHRDWKGHGKKGWILNLLKIQAFFYKDISKIMLNMPARCINADAHLLRACVYIFGWFADVCALVFSKILIVTLFSAMSLSLKFHFHCGIIWKITRRTTTSERYKFLQEIASHRYHITNSNSHIEHIKWNFCKIFVWFDA